ncbi:MAG: hypothetical protein JW880_00615 [Candidatus Thermoplasmatota archaeon]|nr:hypothetical protein [Candidatus Thermoplasmatota archaeon]
MADTLAESEFLRIKAHMSAHDMTLALVRTQHAPGGLTPLLEDAESRLGVKRSRIYSSPMSDFYIAEMSSGDKVLVMLFMAGTSTELVSVSLTDEVALKDIEDSIRYSNFYSEIMRHGM